MDTLRTQVCGHDEQWLTPESTCKLLAQDYNHRHHRHTDNMAATALAPGSGGSFLDSPVFSHTRSQSSLAGYLTVDSGPPLRKLFFETSHSEEASPETHAVTSQPNTPDSGFCGGAGSTPLKSPESEFSTNVATPQSSATSRRKRKTVTINESQPTIVVISPDDLFKAYSKPEIEREVLQQVTYELPSDVELTDISDIIDYRVDSITGWPIKRSDSLESRDNPFVPGGELSREAEDLLSRATVVRDHFYLNEDEKRALRTLQQQQQEWQLHQPLQHQQHQPLQNQQHQPLQHQQQKQLHQQHQPLQNQQHQPVQHQQHQPVQHQQHQPVQHQQHQPVQHQQHQPVQHQQHQQLHHQQQQLQHQQQPLQNQQQQRMGNSFPKEDNPDLLVQCKPTCGLSPSSMAPTEVVDDKSPLHPSTSPFLTAVLANGGASFWFQPKESGKLTEPFCSQDELNPSAQTMSENETAHLFDDLQVHESDTKQRNKCCSVL